MISELLIILIFFISVILLSPVTISVNSSRREGIIDGYFGISWIKFMFSYSSRESRSEIKIFKKRLARFGHKARPQETKEKPEKEKEPMKMPSSGNMLNLIRPFFQLLKDLANCIKLEINIEIKFGANDPAHTGIITGIFYAITGCLKTGNRIKLAIDFEKPCLEWDMAAKAVITPIRLLPAITKFITDRQVLSSGFRILRG